MRVQFTLMYFLQALDCSHTHIFCKVSDLKDPALTTLSACEYLN